MEEDEGWKMYRPAIVIVTILVLIIGSTFLYVFLERGLEGFIDWLADRIIGVMFAGLLAGAFVMFDKLSNKLSVIRMSMHEKRKVQQIPSYLIIGSSLIGVILVSPMISTHFLYFLIGTWVLQTIFILTLYPKNEYSAVEKHISEE